MLIRTIKVLLMAVVVGIMSIPASADQAADAGDTTAAQEYFEAALRKLMRNDFAGAASLLESARDAGMTHPQVTYNLGVSYFRLGRYQVAQMAFFDSMRYDIFASLSMYQLGLMALEQKDNDTARYWFEQSLNYSNEPAFRNIVEGQLAQLSNAPLRPLIAAYLGATHDDNAMQLSTGMPSTLNPSVAYLVEQLSGSLPLDGAVRGVTVSGVTGRIVYDSPYYPTYSWYGGSLQYQRQLRKWLGIVKLGEDWQSLGGKPFQEERALTVTARRNVSPMRAIQFGLATRRYELASEAYSYLAGSNYSFTAQVDQIFKQIYTANLTYTLTNDDKAGLRTPWAFTSYSALRNALSARLTAPLPGNWIMTLDAAYRFSYYTQSNVEPNGFSYRRMDDNFQASATIDYKLTRDTTLSLTYRGIYNNSNASAYTYTSNQFSVGAQMVWR